MYETWLFVDKDYAVLGKDKSQWQEKLKKFLKEHYSTCGDFDSADVGLVFPKVLFCKSTTGINVELWEENPGDKSKITPFGLFYKNFKSRPIVSKEELNIISEQEWTKLVYDNNRTVFELWRVVDDRCDICEVKDLKKPIKSKDFDRIEVCDSYDSSLPPEDQLQLDIRFNDNEDNKGYLEYLELINNNKIDEVLITLLIKK